MRRTLDWVELLRAENIPYIEKGANVKRGEVSIKCPFCGSADPSYHMGLNLENGWWSCWRNRAQHSGKSPLRLIMRLLSVPYWQAREIAGLGADYVDPEGFDAAAARLLGRGEVARPEEVRRTFLRHDPDSLVIDNRARSQRARNYLSERRGFRTQDLDSLIHIYDLRTAVSGPNANRLILPYYLDGELVAWTGRAIGDSTIRYKDLARDECLVVPKETLYNHDAIPDGGELLVIVEGPIDALKMDFYGRDYGVRSVALSTNSVSDEQAVMLHAAEHKFKRVFVMMDNATPLGYVDSMRLKQQLSFMSNIKAVKVPYGSKDSGDLSYDQVIEWARSHTEVHQ